METALPQSGGRGLTCPQAGLSSLTQLVELEQAEAPSVGRVGNGGFFLGLVDCAMRVAHLHGPQKGFAYRRWSPRS